MAGRRSVLLGLASLPLAGLLWYRDGLPDYASWIPAPSHDDASLDAIDQVAGDTLAVAYVDTDRVIDSPLEPTAREIGSLPGGLPSLPFEERAAVLVIRTDWARAIVVPDGSRADLETWAEGVPVQPDEVSGAYEVYEMGSSEAALGPAGAVLASRVRPFVAAVRGERPRIHETDDRWATALSRASRAPAVRIGTGLTERGVPTEHVTVRLSTFGARKLATYHVESGVDAAGAASRLEATLPTEDATVSVDGDVVTLAVSLEALAAAPTIEASVDVIGDGSDHVEILVTTADHADQLVLADDGNRVVAVLEAMTGAYYTVADDSGADVSVSPGSYVVVADLGALEVGDSLADASAVAHLDTFELTE